MHRLFAVGSVEEELYARPGQEAVRFFFPYRHETKCCLKSWKLTLLAPFLHQKKEGTLRQVSDKSSKCRGHLGRQLVRYEQSQVCRSPLKGNVVAARQTFLVEGRFLLHVLALVLHSWKFVYSSLLWPQCDLGVYVQNHLLPIKSQTCVPASCCKPLAGKRTRLFGLNRRARQSWFLRRRNSRLELKGAACSLCPWHFLLQMPEVFCQIPLEVQTPKYGEMEIVWQFVDWAPELLKCPQWFCWSSCVSHFELGPWEALAVRACWYYDLLCMGVIADWSLPTAVQWQQAHFPVSPVLCMACWHPNRNASTLHELRICMLWLQW